jgi:hypothetical protein
MKPGELTATAKSIGRYLSGTVLIALVALMFACANDSSQNSAEKGSPSSGISEAAAIAEEA